MNETVHTDVAIIGSGPAGVAVAEQLARENPDLTISVIERGPLLLRAHFYDGGGSIRERDKFVERHRRTPWLGSLAEGGGLLPILGGRGTVGGAQLHRFYAADMTAWTESKWPMSSHELAPYFDRAEAAILGVHSAQGQSQMAALELFGSYGATHPPSSQNGGPQSRKDGGYPHRSSVERLLTLAERVDGTPVRLLTETVARKLQFDRGHPETAVAVDCLQFREGRGVPLRIEFDHVVLSASPVESTRLLLNSVSANMLSPATGRYLADHLYVRGYIDVKNSPLDRSPLNIFIPPQSSELSARYQIEIRSSGEDSSLLRITGSAAMDPDPDNRVWLSSDRVDEFGIPRADTHLARSEADELRVARMAETIETLKGLAGGKWSVPMKLIPTGGSFHEAGTLRIGESHGHDRVADAHGLVDGFTNVYTGDAAAFPTVGVANPILTLTALGYRLAERISTF
jgi:choline dehydrogenase-like flavoprotein